MKTSYLTTLGLSLLVGACSSTQQVQDKNRTKTTQGELTAQEASYRKTNDYMSRLKTALTNSQAMYLETSAGKKEWLTQEDTQKVRDILIQAQPDYNQDAQPPGGSGAASAADLHLNITDNSGNPVFSLRMRPAFNDSEQLIPAAPLRFGSASLDNSLSGILTPIRQRIASVVPEPPNIEPNPIQPQNPILQPTPPRIGETGKPPVAVPVPGSPLEVFSPSDPTKTIRIVNKKTGQRQPSGKKLYDPYSPGGKGIFIVP